MQHRGQSVCPLDEANGTPNQEVEYTRSSLVVRKGKGPPSGILADIAGFGQGQGLGLEADVDTDTDTDIKYGLYDSFSDVIKGSNTGDAYSDFSPPSDILNGNAAPGANYGADTADAAYVSSPLWSGGVQGTSSGHGPGAGSNPILNPRPLSADAMSSFSRFDPEALVHNTEVNTATERLCKAIIPTVAHLLIAEYAKHKTNPNPNSRTNHVGGIEPKSHLQLTGVKLTQYLHRHGINMRHLGLLRKCVSEASTGAADSINSTVYNTACVSLKEELLNQIVSRTLKSLLRDFQRKWMRSEQSTSDQGMKILVAQFVNLALGSHENAPGFWTDQVTLGVYERFGHVALTSTAERIGLFTQVRSIPNLLKKIVMNVLSVTGVVIHPITMERFGVVSGTNPHTVSSS